MNLNLQEIFLVEVFHFRLYSGSRQIVVAP